MTSGPIASTSAITKFVTVRATERHPVQAALVPFLVNPAGRDALLRLTQYSLRLAFYLRKQRTPSTSLTTLLGLVSLLSATRRVLALLSLTSSTLALLSSTYARILRRPHKGKAKAIPPSDPSRPWQILPVEIAVDFARNLLDLTCTLSDATYLFARLRLIPLAPRTVHWIDRTAVVSALGSALLGLVLVHNAEIDVWAEGRLIRKGVLALEERIESAAIEAAKADDDDRRAWFVDEERRFAERARVERRRLKRLRDELTELWWERTRLGAEGLFSTWDVLDLNLGSEAVRTWSGIVSAGILFSQSWNEYYARG